MSSIVVNGDTSGSVTLSAPATAGSVVVTLPATSGTMLTTASTTGISGSAISTGTVAEAYGGTGTSTGYYGFKNRIINGAMMVSQRNGTSSVTPASGAYVIDRFQQTQSTASSLSYQQVAPPTALAGFVYCQKATVLAARTPAAADRYDYLQAVEGLNIMDLAWGTANAKSIAVSFWVYSSVTGTFAFSVVNGSVNRSYVSTYTISSANTWTQVTATIAGDTSGTWATDNSAALLLCFDLGCGSNSETTAGAWQAGFYERTSACVKLVNTLSATFYITGVQLEKGSTATSFDYRPYGTELALCERYYWKSTVGTYNAVGSGALVTTTQGSIYIKYPTTMRAAPTLSYSGTVYLYGISNQVVTAIASSFAGNSSGRFDFTPTAAMTAGTGAILFTEQTGTNFVQASAEL